MATHSSTLAGRIPWMKEPGRLQSMGLLRVGHNWATSLSLFTFMHWRRKWQPAPVFLPGESQGRRSLVGCRPWGRTDLDTTAAAAALNKYLLNKWILTWLLISPWNWSQVSKFFFFFFNPLDQTSPWLLGISKFLPFAMKLFYISVSLTTLKPLAVWNCGKFLETWEYQTILPVSRETCMRVKKQQLECCM